MGQKLLARCAAIYEYFADSRILDEDQIVINGTNPTNAKNPKNGGNEKPIKAPEISAYLKR